MLDHNQILNAAKDILSEIVQIRRHIHQNPELSFEEFETSKFIQAYLQKLDIPFQIMANTGVIGLLGQGDRCIALRADIDALPILEETELEFASKNEGKMHACGHDMHTAMLLGAATILKNNEASLGGQIKLIFQPAEEKLPGGASILIKEGVLENPKVEAVFGQHIYPGESVGKIAISDGFVMGSADELYWTIRGTGTHAAQPHLGHDPILAASQLIIYYQTLMTKYRNPLDAGVLTVASIHGGSATNIIPEEVKMKGTLRSFNLEWREKIHELLLSKSNLIVEAYGCTVDLNIVKGYPPVYNNPVLTKFAKDQSLQLLNSDNTVYFEPKMWGEDFAFYSQNVPSTFWFLGVRPEHLDEMPALHNSKLSPVEDAMVYGISMFVSCALNYFTNTIE